MSNNRFPRAPLPRFPASPIQRKPGAPHAPAAAARHRPPPVTWPGQSGIQRKPAAGPQRAAIQRMQGHRVSDQALSGWVDNHRDRFLQFIQANTPRVRNVLASNVDMYNDNTLTGAVMYQLLHRMLADLDRLWDQYDRVWMTAMNEIDRNEREHIRYIVEIEHDEAYAAYQQAYALLIDMEGFFKDYQDYQDELRRNPPVGLFDAPPLVKPVGMTVRQAMAAEDQIAAYNLRIMAQHK